MSVGPKEDANKGKEKGREDKKETEGLQNRFFNSTSPTQIFYLTLFDVAVTCRNKKSYEVVLVHQFSYV